VATKAIVGEKTGMTQIWDEENRAIPVTAVKVAPLRVVQVKTPETDGYSALQVTWGTKKASRINRPEAGHFEAAGVEPGAQVMELRLDSVGDYVVGQEISVDIFEAGEKIDVIAVYLRGRGEDRRHCGQQGQGLCRWHEASQLQGPGSQPR